MGKGGVSFIIPGPVVKLLLNPKLALGISNVDREDPDVDGGIPIPKPRWLAEEGAERG